MLAVSPFAHVPLDDTELLVPIYASSLLTVEIITSSFLMTLFAAHRSRGVLALSVGYLFSALTSLLWVATLPGLSMHLGLAEPGPHTAASIAAIQRLGFPFFVLAYVLLGRTNLPASVSSCRFRAVIGLSITSTAFSVGVITWLLSANGSILPNIIECHIVTSTATRLYIPNIASAAYLIVILLLWTRGRSVLDLWIMVIVYALLIDVILYAFLGSGLRFSVGWWAGRLYSLASATVVLIILLVEATSLSARLARSATAERRSREARLLTMQALSASVAHELNQPLASMVTNANAGLRWLTRENPNLSETRAALKRIVTDGHRAGTIVEGVRTIFRGGCQPCAELDVNKVILDVLSRFRAEARLASIAIRTDLNKQLPAVSAHAVQLEQVISNLVANAIDALQLVRDRNRILRIESSFHVSGDILLTVEDSGPGILPEHRGVVFEPFFTTKPAGTGVGLTIARLIVEAHGGRLWHSSNMPHGAIFQFTLPTGPDSTPSTEKGDT
jgi:signal transduction histidine kinase